MTEEQWPRTLKRAWDNLFDQIIESGICYRAGGQLDGEWRPVDRNGMNYGEAVVKAFDALRKNGNGMTIQQIESVRQLIIWTARASCL